MNKFAILGALVALMIPAAVMAQQSDFTVESFAAEYYLDRDSQGVSLLVTDETINAKFPVAGSDLTGLKRYLQLNYGGRNTELKIVRVTDITGRDIVYSTFKRQNDLLVNIGDPDITVFGSQGYKLNYEARGVINFQADYDLLLLAVNGRGWQQPFNSVFANLHIPATLKSQLQGKPQCYIGSGDKELPDCKIEQKDGKNGGLLITAAATKPLSANQTLAIRQTFEKSTFQPPPPEPAWYRTAIYALTAGLLGLVMAAIIRGRVSGRH